VVGDFYSDLYYQDDNLDDDMAAFGDDDPRTLSYDSEDDDCKNVIYNREVMEVVNKMAINDETINEKVVSETMISETVVDEHVVHIEAHPEEADPFHRNFPSPNEEDDLEEDENTLVDRCDERIRKIVHFFHDKAKTISRSSVKQRTAWMNFAFLPNLKKSDPDMVSSIFSSLIPRNVRTALGHRYLRREHLMSLPQVDTDKESPINKAMAAKVKKKRQPRGQRKAPEKKWIKVVYLLFGEDETEGHRNDAVYPGPSTLNGDNRMGEHSEIMSAPAKLARAGGKRSRALFCHRFIVRHNFKPHFMEVATFSEKMPEYNLKRTDRGWLGRLV
jgi:hypothetical protein